jgi:anti-anti-sigma regulatory factor
MTGTIIFRDELTINQVEEGISKLKMAIERWNNLVIDVTGVEKIDVAALQMLIAAKKDCLRNGKKLVFCISDAVSSMSSLIGIQL